MILQLQFIANGLSLLNSRRVVPFWYKFDLGSDSVQRYGGIKWCVFRVNGAKCNPLRLAVLEKFDRAE